MEIVLISFFDAILKVASCLRVKMYSQLSLHYLEGLEGTQTNTLTLGFINNFFLKESQKGITWLLIQSLIILSAKISMTEAGSKL